MKLVSNLGGQLLQQLMPRHSWLTKTHPSHKSTSRTRHDRCLRHSSKTSENFQKFP